MLPAAASFVGATFRQQRAYAVANLAGLFTNLMFLVLRTEVMQACYGHSAVLGGLTPVQATSYAALTQAMLMVAPQWGVTGLGADVRSGQIAVALLRPVDPYVIYLAQRLGVSLYYVFGRMLPVLLVSLLTGLLLPPSPAGLLSWALALSLGAVVAIQLQLLVECSSFWLQSDHGVRSLLTGVGAAASGLLLPLSWYPGPLQALFRALPFSCTMAVPTELWLGTAGPETLLLPLFWIVALGLIGRGLLELGLRRLVVNGG
jgi:ABC-2 type transport system permease protein